MLNRCFYHFILLRESLSNTVAKFPGSLPLLSQEKEYPFSITMSSVLPLPVFRNVAVSSVTFFGALTTKSCFSTVFVSGVLFSVSLL